MKITITIETGNDAMKSAADVALALESLANRIKRDGAENVFRVLDENGNSVGTVHTEPGE